MSENTPDIWVYAEYGWTCQACFATVKAYASEADARTDSKSHQCEEYST